MNSVSRMASCARRREAAVKITSPKDQQRNQTRNRLTSIINFLGSRPESGAQLCEQLRLNRRHFDAEIALLLAERARGHVHRQPQPLPPCWLDLCPTRRRESIR